MAKLGDDRGKEDTLGPNGPVRPRFPWSPASPCDKSLSNKKKLLKEYHNFYLRNLAYKALYHL